MFNKMIEQLNKQDIKLNKTFIGDNVPNDGGIVETIRELIIDFNNKEFNVYVFKGIFKRVYQKKSFSYKFNDIKLVQFGKYSFKHPFIKIGFKDEKYLVFSYFTKIRSHENQNKYLSEFIEKLEEIKENIEKEDEKT